MTRSTVMTGVFASPGEAQQARSRLLEAGMAENCIAISTDLGADGVAAEFPGQTYSNQPGQGPGEELPDVADMAHIGACVLTVELASNTDRKAMELILRQSGARIVPSEH